MHGAAKYYRTGMTGDALLMIAAASLEITLAGFYLLGYMAGYWSC